MGHEERPEWGASPEKPSEPLRYIQLTHRWNCVGILSVRQGCCFGPFF